MIVCSLIACCIDCLIKVWAEWLHRCNAEQINKCVLSLASSNSEDSRTLGVTDTLFKHIMEPLDLIRGQEGKETNNETNNETTKQ